jgi:hypothetical protein
MGRMTIWEVPCEICGHDFSEHDFDGGHAEGEDPYPCNLIGCECLGYSSPEVIVIEARSLGRMCGMTFDDLYRKMLDILPNATMEETSDGQLIICTGLTMADDADTIVPFDPEEDSDETPTA